MASQNYFSCLYIFALLLSAFGKVHILQFCSHLRHPLHTLRSEFLIDKWQINFFHGSAEEIFLRSIQIMGYKILLNLRFFQVIDSLSAEIDSLSIWARSKVSRMWPSPDGSKLLVAFRCSFVRSFIFHSF